MRCIIIKGVAAGGGVPRYEVLGGHARGVGCSRGVWGAAAGILRI